MTHLRFILSLAVAALIAASAVTRAEAAMTVLPSPQPDTILTVQGNCSAIAQQVAAENGGRVGRATIETRGGKKVCVVVVVINAKDGMPTQRLQREIPLD